MFGTLFIVATPIGNLQDITIRALQILGSVEYIASEDTRRTGNLLSEFKKKYPDYFRIERPFFISYYEQSELRRIPDIIRVLLNGKDVALVSDSGTPTISDPGFKLVRTCIEQNIKVVSIPGPSAVISSLVSSGLPTDKFTFVGYLPKKQGNRTKLLEHIKKSQEYVSTTVILYEAPHRIIKTLEELQAVYGDIKLVIARELTKIHEEVLQSRISDVLSKYKSVKPKGEYVILFNLAVQ